MPKINKNNVDMLVNGGIDAHESYADLLFKLANMAVHSLFHEDAKAVYLKNTGQLILVFKDDETFVYYILRYGSPKMEVFRLMSELLNGHTTPSKMPV